MEAMLLVTLGAVVFMLLGVAYDIAVEYELEEMEDEF